MKKSQLNAISRGYTAKTQKQAVDYLISLNRYTEYQEAERAGSWRGGVTKYAQKVRKELFLVDDSNRIAEAMTWGGNK